MPRNAPTSEPADHVIDSLFHALSDSTRRDILRRCIEGDASVSLIASAYPMSFAAVQKHVAVLERAGLVSKERQGREQIVRTELSAVRTAHDVLDHLERAWLDRVGRMSSLLAKDTGEPPMKGTPGMTVITSEKDYETLTMTLVAEFDASIDRVWQLWSDPRQLEQWWGPPTHPATFEQHDLTPGSKVTFVMNGPNGDIHRGWWEVLATDPPKELRFLDGFADVNGNNVEEHPVSTVEVTLSEHSAGTRMELKSIYPTLEGFVEMASVGMEEGWQLCVGQMDAVLLQSAATAR